MREWLDSERWRNPYLVTAAVGLFIVGTLWLVTSVHGRTRQMLLPPGAAPTMHAGYQGLIGENVTLQRPEYVVVTNTALNPGDRIETEMVERRSSRSVVEQFPELRNPQAQKQGEAPLLAGYFDRVEDAVGLFALTELPEGSPLGPKTVASSSPLANPIDQVRPDRFVVPMPPEPTVWQLLVPGDRVDLYFVVPGQVSRRTILNVRVVAVNNFVGQGSGLLSAGQENKQFGPKELASQRKLARIKALQRQQQQRQQQQPPSQPQPQSKGASSGPPPPMEDQNGATKGDETKAGDTKADETKAPEPPPATEPGKAPPPKPGFDTKAPPEGVAKAPEARPYDGRAVTLQVSEQEALLLSLAMRTPKVDIEMSLHRRD
jgi:hypothetical protein